MKKMKKILARCVRSDPAEVWVEGSWSLDLL